MNVVQEKGRAWLILKSLLSHGEAVGFHLVESRVSGASPIDPAHIFATNKRIIIVQEGVLGIGQNVKIISYNNITEILMRHGIFFTKIHFSVAEASRTEGEMKWLIGLKHNEALALVHYVNDEVEKPIATRGEKSMED